MINFNQIPMLNVDALMPLLLEDNAVPPVVDMTGYHGPRSLAEVTAMTARASDISELSRIATAICWGDVQVVRSSVNSKLISPNDHPCLDRDSRWLMSLQDPGDIGANYGQHVQSLFLLQIADHMNGRALWTRTAIYFALGLQTETSLIVPEVFRPSAECFVDGDALDGCEGDWTGLGVSITPLDALEFVQTLARYHPSAEAIGGAISTTMAWLYNLNGAITSGQGLLAEFKAVRPDLGFVFTPRFSHSPRVLHA